MPPSRSAAASGRDAVVGDLDDQRAVALTQPHADPRRRRVLARVAHRLGDDRLRERLELGRHRRRRRPRRGRPRAARTSSSRSSRNVVRVAGVMRPSGRWIASRSSVERGLDLAVAALAHLSGHVAGGGQGERHAEQALDDAVVDVAREVDAVGRARGRARPGASRCGRRRRARRSCPTVQCDLELVGVGLELLGAPVGEQHAVPVAAGRHGGAQHGPQLEQVDVLAREPRVAAVRLDDEDGVGLQRPLRDRAPCRRARCRTARAACRGCRRRGRPGGRRRRRTRAPGRRGRACRSRRRAGPRRPTSAWACRPRRAARRRCAGTGPPRASARASAYVAQAAGGIACTSGSSSGSPHFVHIRRSSASPPHSPWTIRRGGPSGAYQRSP